MELSSAEFTLARSIGFDESICCLVKERTGKGFERLGRISETGERLPADGLSVLLEKAEAVKAVQDLGPPLTQAGYRVFWSVVYHADGRKKSDELAVLRTIDRYEIVRLRQTNGANYGQSNADIVSRLEQWEALCEFEIIGAAIDWVAMEFVSLPRHICSFAEEVYTFCPDSVEQGVGLMRERDHPEAFAAARQLCPKLSAAMEMRLAQQKQRFEAMTPRMPPQLLAMLRSSEAISTPTDTGIRLLAYEINKNRSLFLWWD